MTRYQTWNLPSIGLLHVLTPTPLPHYFPLMTPSFTELLNDALPRTVQRLRLARKDDL